MQSHALVGQSQRLDALIARVSDLPPDQLELQAHWARYLCVLSAGLLENAISDVYGRYAKNRAHGTVANYVEVQLQRVQNPKASRFIEVALSFDRNWEGDLVSFLDENGRKDAIDAIMANRHLIVHGKDSGISLARIKEYLKKSVEVIEFIETQCGLTP